MNRKPLIAALAASLATVPALAAEVTSSAADRSALAVTVYGSDMAVVAERRRLRLPGGAASLVLQDVPAQLRPETVQLSGEGLRLSESRFAYDLLTPEALLERFVGREVKLVRTHPATGEDRVESGTLLSIAGGVPVFRMAGGIETGGPGSPWRLRFDQLPQGLRERPTLIAEVDGRGGNQDLNLAYLSGGLSWRADYVAQFDEEASRLDLTGWATLSNHSGMDYPNARLRLVAGEVNRVSAPQQFKVMRAMAAPAVAEGMAADMAPAASFEYYVYDLPRPVNLADRETRQLPLLATSPVRVRREYRLDSSQGIGWRYLPNGQQNANAAVYMNFENGLGRPLPAGTVRIYGGGADALQLLGEANLAHTPVGGEVELLAGQAFDLTATRTQLRQDRLVGDRYEATWQVKLKNAKKREAELRVIEPMPGDWNIGKSSHEYRRLDANRAEWRIKVPAGGETTLEYRVSWK